MGTRLLILLVLALTLVTSGCESGPDPRSVAPGAGFWQQTVPLPVFVLRRSEIDAGNGILGVYLDDAAPGLIDVTVVFGGENEPLDASRQDAPPHGRSGHLGYVETFTYVLGPAPPGKFGRLRAIRFPGNHAGLRAYGSRPGDEGVVEVLASAFEMLEGRPVLHVATWDHAFSESVETLLDYELETVRDYDVQPSSRITAERTLRDAGGRRN